MANEYLKRTPTSSGNRKIFTYAGWFKKNNADGSTRFDIFNAYNTGNQQEEIGFRADALRYLSSGSTLYGFDTTNKYRDTSNWFHIVFALNTTLESERKRSVIYINGVEVDTTTSSGIGAYVAKNFDSIAFNVVGKEHNVLARKYSSSGRDYAEGGAFDIFFVDGQALTPDVFGFYKDGDGYMSSGTTQATDFKPGQWSPRLPKSIKHTINSSGGFGINGFYLPMNDSSNPGADFHCTPNSVIKLKGEDLPQPRNGAPTTSDAFVSEVRKEIGGLGFAGCIKVDNYGGLVVSDHSDLDLGTGDYTIEGFYYIDDNNVSTGYHALFDFRGTSGLNGKYPAMFRHPNGHIYLYLDGVVRIDNVGFPINEWTHVALSRSSGTTRLFVNGVEKGSFSDTISYICRELKIGHSATQSNPMRGFISNFRVVKGTAVYTSNFTRPTKPLENITNTIVLMAQSATSATAGVAPASISTYAYNSDSVVFATTSELTGSIVLAVPGISTATGANLVTNGHFDTDTTGWTSQDATLSVDNGRIKVLTTNTNYGSALQTVTGLTVGQRYTFQVDMFYGDAALVTAISGASPNINSGWQSADYVWRASFTATTTSLVIDFQMASIANRYGFWDNVVLKQEDTPRDYSADIKGSGTNKTLTPTASSSSGIAYDVPSYYGSSTKMNSGTSDGLLLGWDEGLADYNFGTGDFTMEAWVYTIYTPTTPWWSIFRSKDYNDQVSSPHGGIAFYGNSSALHPYDRAGGTTTSLYGGNIGSVPNQQWTHVALVRDNGRLLTFCNGVCVGNIANTANYRNNGFEIGQNFPWDGYIQDARIYKGLAKYKGGFDVSKPFTPVGIEPFRTSADTCTNNFATWNPLLGPAVTPMSDGNLSVTNNGVHKGTRSTIGVTSGKWYWEYRVGSVVTNSYVGVSHKLTSQGFSGGDHFLHGTGNNNYADPSGSFSVTNGSFTTGMIIGCAFDYDAGTLDIYKDGTLAVEVTGGDFAGKYIHAHNSFNASFTDEWVGNFGQNPSFNGKVTAGTNADSNGKGLFKYAPPSGFLALCEDNLPAPAIADPGEYFKTVLYTGDGVAGRSITGVGFKPDFVWIKARTLAYHSRLFDTVRGGGRDNYLLTSDQGSEGASAHRYGGISSFDNNGFSMIYGNGGSSIGINQSTKDYVAWCWKAGGPAVSNGDGSIISQVSANQTAGFSIVSWTGNGVDGSTIGHGLNKAPNFIISKSRQGTSNWVVLTDSVDGSWDFLYLNLNNSKGDYSGTATDSTISLYGTSNLNRTGENTITYCWTEIEGFSKFGSYVGNADADGTFIYCGFKPAFVITKRTDGTSNWLIHDSSRDPVNPVMGALYANTSAVEGRGSVRVDFVSNGFKHRNADGGTANNYSNDYIFMAWAESPFQTANAK